TPASSPGKGAGIAMSATRNCPRYVAPSSGLFIEWRVTLWAPPAPMTGLGAPSPSRRSRGELDEDLLAVGPPPGRGDAALDHPAERGEMGLEDSLGLVLRQAALELAAAIDAVVSHRAKLDHVRAVEAGTVDMLGGIEEGR